MKDYYGLSEQNVQEARMRYGDNLLAKEKRTSFLRKLLDNLKDPIIRVLLAALVFNVLLTLKDVNLIETFGILLAITVSTVVSTLSEKGSEKAFDALTKETKAQLTLVVRAGKRRKIPIGELVVGDTVYLSSGEEIPADGSVIEGELLVNQAALTGESKEKKKRASKTKTEITPNAENRVFRGSLIVRGSAVMRVDAVGSNTFLGGVAKDLAEDTRKSPLKLRLTRLAATISKIGYCLAVLVALSYLFSAFCLATNFDKMAILAIVTDYRLVLSHLLRALTLAVTIVVVAVPEGLPMMISVVLSSNMKRMFRDAILVKKPVGIETAGSLNILFSDKTGTFTGGEHRVSGFLLASGKLISTLDKLKGESVYGALSESALYNTECLTVGKKIEGSNATDRAIALFFQKAQKPLGALFGGIPFDSRYKYSAAKLPSGKISLKGAPEMLLRYITSFVDAKGDVIPCRREALEALMRPYTEQAARLVMIALADEMPSAVSFPPLTFLAFAVIEDPIRKSTKGAIRTLRDAGIQVVMVTGDSPDTAKAVAAKAGLLFESDPLILTGAELSSLSDDELADLLPRIAVVARALPGDKTRLVRVAQSKDLVVGMTGDGVNDAPALKLADVGFAMGSGTDIAKEAGDIVILNNDMAAMVKAVLYGRTIFKSIQKFIIFQLTMNFCAVGVTLIGPLFGLTAPITVVQMLWVNMIMDTLGGLAFAGEAPEQRTLREKPKTRREPLLSRRCYGKILYNGLSALTICTVFMSLAFFRKVLSFEEKPLIFYSSLFSLFIFMGVVMFYIARSDRLNFVSGLLENTAFLFITVLVTAVQLLMVYFGGALFRTAPLSPKILLGVALLSLILLPIDLVRRAILKKAVSV